MAYGSTLVDTISSSGNLTITGNVTTSGTITSSTGTTYPLVSGTAQATTSGTTVNFSSIPSWVKRLTIIFSAVSTSGTSFSMVQIGSGSIVTTGYTCIGSAVNNSTQGSASYTTGFTIRGSGAATTSLSGQMILTNITGNTWVCSSVIADTGDSRMTWTAGTLTLSGILDLVRLTTVNGTDTVDAGSVNILYEQNIMAITLDGTTGMVLSTWTTAGRPTSPVAGQFGFNSTLGYIEWYSSTASSWIPIYNGPSYAIDYLVVAGGGGGATGGNGDSGAGGGGAGGLSYGSVSVTFGQSYAVVVGAGGTAASTTTNTVGTSGTSSSFFGVVPTGGGRGGAGITAGNSAGNGGSGGGNAGEQAVGTGVSGEGFAGAMGSTDSSTYTSGGGGGGATTAGQNSGGRNGGNGGTGYTTSISGTSTPYAGGGAGGRGASGSNGTGGSGGGGGSGVAGTVNTGGGGGGNFANGSTFGAAGGSGIVIISYLGAQRGTGGTVTSSGGYTIHTFTSTGTYTA